MHDALNELMSYATTLNFVSQGAWGDTEMEAVSSVREVQSKSRRVVEKGSTVFRIGEPNVLGSFWMGGEERGSDGDLVARFRNSATVTGTSRRGCQGLWGLYFQCTSSVHLGCI